MSVVRTLYAILTECRQHLKLALLLGKSLAPSSFPVSPVYFLLMMLCLDGAHVLLTAALEDLLARSLLPDTVHNKLSHLSGGLAKLHAAYSL